MLNWMKGDNDGLVTLESSRWGEFKGFLVPPEQVGLSHGGAIDLFARDFDNFDITEKYIEIVSDLKLNGY
jgi:triacylglycerol lipase